MRRPDVVSVHECVHVNYTYPGKHVDKRAGERRERLKFVSCSPRFAVQDHIAIRFTIFDARLESQAQSSSFEIRLTVV